MSVFTSLTRSAPQITLFPFRSGSRRGPALQLHDLEPEHQIRLTATISSCLPAARPTSRGAIRWSHRGASAFPPAAGAAQRDDQLRRPSCRLMTRRSTASPPRCSGPRTQSDERRRERRARTRASREAKDSFGHPCGGTVGWGPVPDLLRRGGANPEGYEREGAARRAGSLVASNDNNFGRAVSSRSRVSATLSNVCRCSCNGGR